MMIMGENAKRASAVSTGDAFYSVTIEMESGRHIVISSLNYDSPYMMNVCIPYACIEPVIDRLNTIGVSKIIIAILAITGTFVATFVVGKYVLSGRLIEIPTSLRRL